MPKSARWGEEIAAQRRAEEGEQEPPGYPGENLPNPPVPEQPPEPPPPSEQEPPETFRESGAPDPEDRFGRIEAAIDTLANAIQQQGEVLADVVGVIRSGAPAPGQPAPPPPELIQDLPPGLVRFASPFSNYLLILEPSRRVLVNGEPISTDEVAVRFANGIADVDEEMAEALRRHPEFGLDFIEDPTAVPRSQVQVVDGPRSVGGDRVVPQGGRIAVRLPG